MTRLGRRRAGSRLFAVYAAASLVPVTILGVILVHDYQDGALERGRDQGRAQASVIMQMAVAPSLSGIDLSERLTNDERARLRSATDLAIFSGSVSHLRLRSFSGTVAFSDDDSVLDALPVSDPAFQAASNGGTDVRIVPGATPLTDTIRVLEPVIAASNGQATGVLEIYLPYHAIALKVQAETNQAIARLGLGLLALYAVLALISWWTSRSLRRLAAADEHQSLHDPLTGLPNRELFRLTMEDALARGQRGERGALVLADLDHFKDVNDTLGHSAGDDLLRVVGRRLIETLRTDDTVARLGGDEFGLVLPRSSDRSETVALLARVRRALSEEVVLEGVALRIEASFGVCFYPDDADTVENLLHHADVAMYQGKHNPSGIVLYEPATAPPAMHAITVQSELRRALERDELVLHYQPKIELATGRTDGVEALVRWQHPERGLLPPSEFLPAAENSDLIESLTTWVLRRALADHAAWTEAGHRWTVAVNVSARNLASMDFVDLVCEILQESGVQPDQLHLEVTETALAFDPTLAMRVITALSDHGISVAIDNFGVGYTSLSQLAILGVSEIKIDRTFTTLLPGTAQDRAIVRSVIDLGHSLGCLVTATGVESKDVADWLLNARCDLAQGFLWLRPAPWPEVASPPLTLARVATSVAATLLCAPAVSGNEHKRASI
jgi:diguanylate cyclase (GGDEF)-like protein